MDNRNWRQRRRSYSNMLLLLLFIHLPAMILGLHDLSPRIWGTTTERLAFSARSSQISSFEEIESRAEDYSGVQIREIHSRQENKISGAVSPRETSHSPHIIIIGGPASGKGTQCEHLAAKYGVVHLSTGDMLREAVKDGSSVGRTAEEYMNRGELVPDEVIIQIVSARLDQDDCHERGWLLDGFPRTKAQAEHLSMRGIEADVTLLLDVPDSELIARVVGRRRDPETGKIYHLKFRPPPLDIIGRLEQRSDDTVEKVKRRLEQFHENLSEIKPFVADSVVEIDGTGAPEIIAKDIAAVVDLKVRQKVRA